MQLLHTDCQQDQLLFSNLGQNIICYCTKYQEKLLNLQPYKGIYNKLGNLGIVLQGQVNRQQPLSKNNDVVNCTSTVAQK